MIKLCSVIKLPNDYFLQQWLIYSGYVLTCAFKVIRIGFLKVYAELAMIIFDGSDYNRGVGEDMVIAMPITTEADVK